MAVGLLGAHSATAPHRPGEPRILILSGDEALWQPLVELLGEFGTEVSAGGRPEALARLEECRAIRILVLADGRSFSALEVLDEARRLRDDVAILFLSGSPTVALATEAVRHGAEDFVPVPYAEEVLRKEVVRILEAAELRDRVEHLRHLVGDSYGFERIISQSPKMRSVFSRMLAAARSETPVLIFGETGTGKELIARAIHANSRRAKRAFVPLNCAALPRDLVESEMFGHRRGAFSGALNDHPGLFVAANGGTLFLDEISELPLESQAKLLRVVQDGEVRPVGGLDSRRTDVRIVAASNRNLTSLSDGGFREDLFYRLSVLVIEVPPLRERLDDLPLLVAYFLASLRDRGIAGLERIDDDALDLLAQYAFPGNVRELQNFVESVGATAPPRCTSIAVDDVRRWLRRRHAPVPAATGAVGELPLKLSELEAWAIAEALRRASGNKRLAAHMLGISRDTLYRKLADSPRVSGSRT
jgi:DNA-binding NtrC family response regulator